MQGALASSQPLSRPSLLATRRLDLFSLASLTSSSCWHLRLLLDQVSICPPSCRNLPLFLSLFFSRSPLFFKPYPHFGQHVFSQVVKSLHSQSSSCVVYFSPTKNDNICEGNQHWLDFILHSDLKQINTIKSTKSFHALAIIVGIHQPIFVHNNLVTLYGRFGDIVSATQVFYEMPERNTASWNSIIAAYARHGPRDEAWKLFLIMMNNGFMPNQFTLGSVLPLCCSSSSLLAHAVQLHGLMVKTGFSEEVYAGTALVDVLVKHSCLDDAINFFDEMPQRSVVTWNVVISGFAEQGLSKDAVMLFRELMRSQHIRPSEFSFVAVVNAYCQMQGVDFGEQIHGLVVKFGVMSYVMVTNAIINMYAKCVGFGNAERLFDEMTIRDSISWNTLIMSFMKNGRDDNVLELCLKMFVQGFRPSQRTLSMVVSSCARIGNLSYGRFVHAKAIKTSFELDSYVGSAIIALYAKCDHLTEALKVFHRIQEKSMVHLNALMHGAIREYANTTTECTVDNVSANLFIEGLLREMMKSDVSPNEYTFSYLLRRLSISLENGLLIFSQIIRRGLDKNPYVSSSIVSMFAEKGLISDVYLFVAEISFYPFAMPWNAIAGIFNRSGKYCEAYSLLSRLRDPDSVSWNIIIAAYSRNQNFREAFECFRRMQNSGTLADNYTFTSLLSSCSKLCNLGVGQTVHSLMLKTNFERCDILVQNVLMNMYAKCGSLDSSIKVFDSIPQKNIMSWTMMISAFGLHGQAKEAIESFRKMQLQGIQPDYVTLLAVLSACKHAGLKEEGLSLFQNMKSVFGIEPDVDHLVCIVDLLCKSGHPEQAEKVINSTPFGSNPMIWRTFLAGCRGKCCW